MICFSLWFWLWCAFTIDHLRSIIIFLSKCTSRLADKRIHIKLVSSVNFLTSDGLNTTYVTDEIPFISEYRSLQSLVRPFPVRFLLGKNSLVTRWQLTDDNCSHCRYRRANLRSSLPSMVNFLTSDWSEQDYSYRWDSLYKQVPIAALAGKAVTHKNLLWVKTLW